MKQILFLTAILSLFLFTSCSKDDEPAEQTFHVNVYKKWQDSDKEFVKKAVVYLFADENKSIDNTKSASSIITHGVITYTDGTAAVPEYATKFQPGVFNMENIANGEYILWVTYMIEYGGICYSSYKKISVNYDYRGKVEEKIFRTATSDTGIYIYQNW